MEEYVNTMFSSIANGQWTLLAGAICMVAVHLFRVFAGAKSERFRSPAAAIVANAICGVVVAVATGLLSDVPWWQAIITGLLTSAASGGLWSLFGKRVLAHQLPEEGDGA